MNNTEPCMNTDRGPDTVCPFCKVPLTVESATYGRIILTCTTCNSMHELVPVLTPVLQWKLREILAVVGKECSAEVRKKIQDIYTKEF